jgi:hypothetical protein
MLEENIRSVFSRNWVFWLYSRRKLPWYLIIAITALLPMIIGASWAAFLGVFRLYFFSFLTYSGPMLIALSLVAYHWFYVNFPRELDRLIPAIDIDDTEAMRVITKWANRVANRIGIMIVAGIPIGFVGLVDTLSLWITPTGMWLGTPWVTSSRPLFFALVYAFYYVLAMGFLLGSGVVGTIGTGLIIGDLLRRPLKLDYYRRMQAVTHLSTGVGSWAFVAFASILIASSFVKPLSDPKVVFSSILLSCIASVGLLVAFLSPLLAAHNAIVKAKKVRLAVYEERLSQLSEQIETVLSTGITGFRDETHAYLENLEAFNKERSLIIQQVGEIESISDWPITFANTLRFALTALITPFVGQIADHFVSMITALVP